MKDNAFAQKNETALLGGTLKPVPVGERIKTFSETVTESDKTYTINTAFDLGGKTVRLPHGVVLKFTGKGKLTNGAIIGDRCMIIADRRIFYNVQVGGSWECTGDARWFTSGCDISETAQGVPHISKYVDDYDGLQDALDSSFGEVIFPPRLYYTTRTLVLRREKRLTLQGASLSLGLAGCPNAMRGAAVIFTKANIAVLQIANQEYPYQKTMAVIGGNFDVSLCKNYSKSCIEVRSDANERVWGLTIETTVHNAYGSSDGIGIDVNPVENRKSTGYITQVRIKSNVYNFGIGVKVRDYYDKATMAYYNWCSDIVIDGCISNCKVAVDSNADTDIRAMLQSGKFWPVKDNGVPLVRFSGLKAAMNSNVYDIRMSGGGGWSNEYALEVTDPSATVTAGGLFKTFFLACKKLGWPVVKGKIET